MLTVEKEKNVSFFSVGKNLLVRIAENSILGVGLENEIDKRKNRLTFDHLDFFCLF